MSVVFTYAFNILMGTPYAILVIEIVSLSMLTTMEVLDMKIITNHNHRQFTYRSDVPHKVLTDQFEHLSEEDCIDGFFCYKDWWYHTSDFLRLEYAFPESFEGWHGYLNDTAFSGVLIKCSSDNETYQVATFLG